MNIPNIESLSAGAVLSVLLASRTIEGDVTGYLMFAAFVLIGIPIAFLFLMYSHPKSDQGFNIGIVLAFPICMVLAPIIGLTMIANKPWQQDAWKNRGPAKSTKEKESDGEDSESSNE